MCGMSVTSQSSPVCQKYLLTILMPGNAIPDHCKMMYRTLTIGEYKNCWFTIEPLNTLIPVSTWIHTHLYTCTYPPPPITDKKMQLNISLVWPKQTGSGSHTFGYNYIMGSNTQYCYCYKCMLCKVCTKFHLFLWLFREYICRNFEYNFPLLHIC